MHYSIGPSPGPISSPYFSVLTEHVPAAAEAKTGTLFPSLLCDRILGTLWAAVMPNVPLLFAEWIKAQLSSGLLHQFLPLFITSLGPSPGQAPGYHLPIQSICLYPARETATYGRSWCADLSRLLVPGRGRAFLWLLFLSIPGVLIYSPHL